MTNNSMTDAKKRSYIIAGIVVVIVVFSLMYYYVLSQPVAKLFADLGTTNTLAIVNGVATAMLAIVATMNGIEARRVRSEVVRPRLALEPTFFEYDTKTGEPVGFNVLSLVNGGTLARDVEIDVHYSGKSSFLYNSSVGTNDRVQIWSGKSTELGGTVVVGVKYKNMYNKSLQEVLSINIDSLNVSKRKFAPVHKHVEE
jgi:hypothetical protein